VPPLASDRNARSDLVISEWESRVENSNAKKQIALLRNRINLLKIEQSKRLKRIEMNEKKSYQVLKIRDEHDQFESLVWYGKVNNTRKLNS
jgi:hypothetical protein